MDDTDDTDLIAEKRELTVHERRLSFVLERLFSSGWIVERMVRENQSVYDKEGKYSCSEETERMELQCRRERTYADWQV